MRSLFVMLLSLSFFTLFAQEKAKISDFFVHKNEIGVNATNILGNVLSLNPGNIGSPYALTYRRHVRNFSFRFGGNYNQDQNSELEFVDLTRISKLVKEKSTDLRLGVEVHYVISKKMMFSIGLDGVYSRFLDDSEISNSSNTGPTIFFNSKETRSGIGGGPVLRFDFKLNNRISFSTESTMYYVQTKSVDELFVGNASTSRKEQTDQNFSLTLPQSLFVNIAF
jgi:hypothetical protein